VKDLAIIVPYRDREEHLKKFIPHMKNYLTRKGFSFDFYIIEQEEEKPFNRGKLLNVGFDIASKKFKYPNFCFHDVDLLPINVDYSYTDMPTHLSSEVEQLGWRYPPIINGFEYPDIFGGITLFTEENFKGINGYNNEYWGWGAEDDDLLQRIKFKKHPYDRRIPGATRSLKHERHLDQENYSKNIQKLNEMRSGILNFMENGLSNLSYTILEDKSNNDFYMYRVSI
jgi:hypothetical protein